MIKVNVEINNKSWHRKIKNPQKYFNHKLKKISKIVNFFKAKNITFTILLTNSLNMQKLNKKENPDSNLDFLFLFHFNPISFCFNLDHGINTGNFRYSGNCR